MKLKLLIAAVLILPFACNPPQQKTTETIDSITTPFLWENANIYFMLTDRFNNGDPGNDQQYDRKPDGAVLRSFMGGDIAGITKKLEEGYFTDLGINAIWMTPPFEQVHGYTDEGTGKTYAFHGYWISDWTTLDPNFGTIEEYKKLIDLAHSKGIRILMDVVINHTGPVTQEDTVWPEEWVRTEPTCTYQDFETTVTCTLVDNLPDIKTESNENVELPEQLVTKWKNEGRYEKELAELDEFFNRTGYPKAPRFYIMKWLTDYVRDLGIDGYRVDTAKHTEIGIWLELYKEAQLAFAEWKKNNPDQVLDDTDFFMMGEVYGYSLNHGQQFPMGGDSTVNFFQNGFKSLINFSFRSDANKDYDEIYSQYDEIMNGEELKDFGIINYISSHDDGSPFDKQRKRTFESANKIMLAPGASQVYYGDETGRSLDIPGTEGDATLRSFMNWEDLANNDSTKLLYEHWSKLGNFKISHPAIGAGVHSKISDAPYTFSRSYEDGDYSDKVVVSINNASGEVSVASIFAEGSTVKDYYTNQVAVVKNGAVKFENSGQVILIEQP